MIVIMVTVQPLASLLRNPPHFEFAKGKGGGFCGYFTLLAANCAAGAQLQAELLLIMYIKIFSKLPVCAEKRTRWRK